MPLSAGILIGLLTFVVGIALFAFKQKRIAKIMMLAGVAISIITILVIVLAVNSMSQSHLIRQHYLFIV